MQKKIIIINLSNFKLILKIQNNAKNKNYKLVVVTHHPPTYKVLENCNKNKKYLSLYSNNLDQLLNKNKINTWICGHTHKNFDLISSLGTRLVSNQKGKKKDKIYDFYKNFVINL